MPFGVAAAAGIGAVGSIIGGSNAASAAQSAANTQAQAAEAATQAELQMFGTTQKNLAPWMTAGGNALTALQFGLGIGPGPTSGGTAAAPGAPVPGATPATGAGGFYNFNGQSIPMADIVAAGQNQGQISQAIQNSVLGGNMPGNGPTSLTPAQQAWMQLTNGGNTALPASFTSPTAPAGSSAAPGAASPSSATMPLGFGTLLTPASAAQYIQSPGYQFQVQQGENAVLNNATATGGVGGNALRDLTTFGQGVANTDYQQWVNNYTNQQKQYYDMLSGLSGQGANAAANLGGFAINTGNQIGSNLIGAGNAQAAGTVGAANAWNSAIGGVGNNALLGYMLSNNYGMGGGGGSGVTTPYDFYAGTGYTGA